ncbi:MAG: ATP-binding protein, partial [Flavobacterium sp.]
EENSSLNEGSVSGIFKDILQLKPSEELRLLKVISYIDIFLCRDRDLFPVNNASSGELTLISSLIYFASSIDINSIVLIDEPENSLHPKWQTEYIKLLMDLFYRYEPKVVIATHSPLIINAAEITSRGVKVFKGTKGKFNQQPTESQNAEEIYQEYFNVTTPENRYLRN